MTQHVAEDLAVQTHDLKKREFSGALFRRALLGVALFLGLAGSAVAQAPAGEGIQVHGEWTVTVRNPDGTIVQEFQFANALIDTALLKGIFLGNLHPVDYGIAISAEGLEEACSVYDDSFTPVGVDGANAVSLATNFAFGNDCIVAADWTLAGVGTTLITASVVSTGPSTLELQSLVPGDFTQKTLDAPITGILPDQVVTVKVVISFS